MRALTVTPLVAGSARLDDIPEPAHPDPARSAMEWHVETLFVGVCGTDAEIIAGHYGEPPPGSIRLVIGHEAVCRVVDTPSGATVAAGDLVVPIVRRPDPVPCRSCAAGEWDMCQNGRYTEHGIRGADGFLRDRFWLDGAFAVHVPTDLGARAVLVEPASVVAKAWEQIERIGSRSHWDPRTVLVTGAGPIGLLAALLATERGYETHVLDRVSSGPKPDLVAALGGFYHTGPLRETCPPPDIVLECTGVGPLVLEAMEHSSRNGIVCLTGLSSGARTVDLDAAMLNRRLVLENDVVFGTVNANRRHYELAVQALGRADAAWLDALMTRCAPVDRWSDALTKEADDVKTVIEMTR
jgi:threonine dehydrogenase-like Zn-dependent dehydrogenase